MEDVLLSVGLIVLASRLNACVVTVCPTLLDYLLLVVEGAEHLRLVAAALPIVVDDLVRDADLLLTRRLGVVHGLACEDWELRLA